MADPYDPGTLAGRARRRRWNSLIQLFPDLQEMSVVDLGGDTRHWAAAPVRPRRLVLLNTRGYALDEAAGEGAELVYGDACDPPDSLTDQRFDLVYSNSVIEHVGGAWRRRAFAESVHRLGPGHWIQTPYRYFPLEPHWLVPGFQFLPLATRAAFDRIWPLRPSGPRSPDEARGPAPVESALDVELLTKTEMRYLFPSSELIEERFAGLTKSLIAVRTLDVEPAKD